MYVDLVQSLGHDVLLDMSTHASNAVFLVMWPIFNVLLVNLLVAGLCPSPSPSPLTRILPLSPSPPLPLSSFSLSPSFPPSFPPSLSPRTHLGVDGVGACVHVHIWGWMGWAGMCGGRVMLDRHNPSRWGEHLQIRSGRVCVQGVGWGGAGDQQ